jgi:hypothetical protein
MPVVFVRRRMARVEVKANPDTLIFEPDADQFSIVWRAGLRLRRDIFEMPYAVIGRISRARWRAAEYGKEYRSLDSIVREKIVARANA